ncbi:YjdF family protein, partial [Dactylosporangium aurantiacum]
MATLTVFFDDPFWVAVLELHDDGRVRATRHVFGAEPTDAELHQFLLRHGTALLARAERAAPVDGAEPAAPARNPKRLAREAQRARPGTAAQEALRKELELRKQASAARSRQDREAHAEHRRAARRARSRARHK